MREQIYTLGQRGMQLWQQDRLNDSLESFQAILAIDPACIEAIVNVAKLLAHLDRHADALAYFERAIALQPSASLYVNYGLALRRCGRLADSFNANACALALDPFAVDAHANHADLLLLYGLFEDGWREFEWRHRVFEHYHGTSKRAYHQLPDKPVWTGGYVDHLMIHHEQGFGDTIQSARYIQHAADRVGAVSVLVQSGLRPILQYSLAADSRIEVCQSVPEGFDQYCWIDGLPGIFQAGLEAIPNAPYLSAPTSPAWAGRFGHLPSPRVGLVMQGGGGFLADRWRSIHDLAVLAPLLDLPVGWVSLQCEKPFLDARVFDAAPHLVDWTATAQAIAELDLVIAVDTGVVHLAGAMGKTVWLLNRYDSCWRWQLGRSTSDWYPTMTIFRQPAPGDWESVIGDVRIALETRLNSG